MSTERRSGLHDLQFVSFATRCIRNLHIFTPFCFSGVIFTRQRTIT
jgi:hypothetical protein